MKATKTGMIALLSAALSIVAYSQASGPRSTAADRPEPEELVVEMVANHDANENNALEVDELESAIAAMRAEREALRQERREARLASGKELPERGNGRLDFLRPTPAEIAPKLLANFDADESGNLDTEELLNTVTSLEKHRQSCRGKARSAQQKKRFQWRAK